MNCQKCKQSIRNEQKHLKCAQCVCVFHVSCLNEVTDEDYTFIMSSKNNWKCSECLKNKSVRGDETPVTPTIEKSKFTYSTGNSDSEATNSEGGTIHKIVCRKCRKGFSHNAHRAKCTKCKFVFHHKCSISKEDYSLVEMSWVCDFCTEKPNVRDVELSLKKSQDDNITLLDILKEMKSFRTEVASKNKEFTDSLNTYSEWVQDNSEQIKSFDKKLSSITKEIDTLRQENCNLRKNNELLTKKVVDLEQAFRENTIEIYGVPYKSNENIPEVMNTISQVIDFAFKPEMIDNCYRIKTNAAGPAQSGSIVVRFLRKLDKERFIMKRKQKRNVNSRDLGFMEGEASPIYINESLTQEKRKLLNAARVAKREKQYTFIWVNNGRVFLRKNQGDPAVVVNSLEDIAKLS